VPGGRRPPGDSVVQRAAVVTRSLAEARALIAQMYADAHLHLGSHEEDFEFRMASLTVGPIACGLLHYAVPGRMEMAAADLFTTVATYAGATSYARTGKADCAFTTGGLWRIDTEEPTDALFSSNSTFGTLQLPLSLISDLAAESAGGEVTAVRFLDNVAVDDAAQRYWVQLMRFAHQQADALESPLINPLIRSHLTRTLAAASLTTFANIVVTAGRMPGPGNVGPATLRRAAAHLHAHAAEPITVAQAAAAAGIGVRALQEAFVRHYGCTPMAYLRRLRLQLAHDELRAADPTGGDTVGTIAAHWGFAHGGKFAAAYRSRYGINPSDTLHA
jgi:AraC-like DNA-binding protein